MKELSISHLYLEVDGHNLMELDEDVILDAIEVSVSGREYRAFSGVTNRYVLINIDGQLLGAGFHIVDDTLVVRTILTEYQVMENEKRASYMNAWQVLELV